MFILDKNITKVDKKEIEQLYDRLNGQFLDVIADILLLSYTKDVMQDLVKKNDSKEEAFIERAKDIIPLNFADSCYKGYKDIYEKKWNYLCFVEDKASGFESISFFKDEILIIGIAGSDKSVEDWIDNDARLLIPRGILVPTQFKIVGEKMAEILNNYKEKNNSILPKEIIITGNSLGGAVSVVAYTELFHIANKESIKLSTLTYNSAPFRLEFIEDLLQKINAEKNLQLNEVDIKKYLDGIINLINEDDLLNNILYIFIKNIENFGHLGKYLIIENKGESKDTDILHYAKEHVSIEPIRALTVSKIQKLEYHARSMFDGSAQVIKKNIKVKLDQRIEEYNQSVILLDKVRGGILGTGVGDYYANKEKELTDATKLTLAVAKGLIKSPDDPLKAIGDEIIEWHALDRKYIGNITNIAIENAILTGSFPTGAQKAHQILEGKTAGNCSLKRCLPVALMYTDLDIVITLAGLQSNMTHFDSRVKEACQLYSWLVFLLMSGVKKQDALKEVFGSHLYYGQYTKIKRSDIKCSRYVGDTLLNSLALFYDTDSFEDFIYFIGKIDNSIEIGSIVGGLLGIDLGLKNINSQVKEKINEKIDLLKIAGNLFDERMKEH